jgi:hypothetical protein
MAFAGGRAKRAPSDPRWLPRRRMSGAVAWKAEHAARQYGGRPAFGAHQKAVTPPNSSITTGALVVSTRGLGAGYLQIQAGVVEVDFGDGTTWKARDSMPEVPF